MILLPFLAAIWSGLPGFTRYGGNATEWASEEAAINEDGNGDENRIVEEVDEADYEGGELADRSGAFSRPKKPIRLARERKHAAALHGEDGNKDKERQNVVHRGKPVHDWNLRVVETDSGSGARVRVGKDGRATVPATFPIVIAQDT